MIFYINYSNILIKKPTLEQIIQEKEIQKLIQNLKNFNKESLKFISKNKRIKNNILIVDLNKKTIDNLLLSANYPNIKYMILIKSTKDKNRLSLLLFKNLFNKSDSDSNIGKILNSIGGGDHKDIGGVSFDKKEKNEIIKEILKKLT